MRVVYDTSALATVVSRRDLIIQLQAGVSTGRISIITSVFILGELERVLAAKFGMTKQGAKSRARLLSRVAEVVEPTDIASISRDANDDSILATALTGQAEYIVTLDRDLLVLKRYKNVSIVTLADFKEVLGNLD